MKVKEVERTANVAWSPATHHPIYLAAGTAAQQLDATFSTSAALELYRLNLSDPGQEMELAGAVPSDHRFHKLVWGASGDDPDLPSGHLIGGADNGQLFVWDPAKMLKQEDSLLLKLDKHVGPVAALDINPFQVNLLASGASESEIYLWDLNSPSNPMTPGSKSQPPDDVTCLAWNKQVQHILASTYSGRCVVWDLRKNEPIIKVSDSMTRIKAKLVAWHPDVATQMCLASEDDHTPVIQLWDLRFATSPLKVLEHHQRGVLSVAWCPQDPDLLLSCGKDNRILCWNPNSSVQSGEVVYELPTSNQWSFDVQWCPRNPAVISSCSFDSHVSIYSLMGGRLPSQTPATNKVTDAFSSDPFAQPMSQQTMADTSQDQIVVLKKPPKWLRRPCGASFGFGGKLVTFEDTKPSSPQQPADPRLVNISQVITETDFVSRSNQLESALMNNQFLEFCNLKLSNCQSDIQRSIWHFLKVKFQKDSESQYINLLGYTPEHLAEKISELDGGQADGIDPTELADKMSILNTGSPASEGVPTTAGIAAFDQIASHEKDPAKSDDPLPIAVNDECDGLVTQALLTANFEAAVEVCLHNNKMAEAIILAIAGGRDLLAKTQKRFFQKNSGNLNRLISSVVTKNFEHVIRTCDLDNWKEALALSLTYSAGQDFAYLCDILGARLESEKGGAMGLNACLCYICAGNVDKLVDCWTKVYGTNGNPGALQDLVEKVMILKKAVELAQGQPLEVTGGLLAQKLSQYSELLAAQGNLQTAINYLGDSEEITLSALRDRLMSSLGNTSSSKPFKVINVLPEMSQIQKQAQVQQAQVQQHQQQQQLQQQEQMLQQQAKAQAVNQRQRTNSGFYNAQAGSFQTSTTPATTYYTPAQPATSGLNAPAQPATTFSPQQNIVASSSGTGALSKGPLAQKYPDASYAPTAAYDSYNPSAYQTPYSSGTGFSHQAYSQASAVSSQPQVYDPTAAVAAQHTPGAPYAPASQSGVGAAGGPSVPSYQDIRSHEAWNDPPLVNRKVRGARSTEPQNTFTPQAPITQPIMGVPQDQGPPGGPSYGGAAAGAYAPHSQYQPPQQQITHQHQQVPEKQAPPPEPPKPVEKPPIPEEHKILYDILESVASQCMAKAVNPQMKRKLEDVLRKLEALYDRLRQQALSENVLLGLHQIIQAIQQYDYQTGLAYHTQMISQGNFSEISSFMPGIKVLLQTAAQLQVYVQQ